MSSIYVFSGLGADERAFQYLTFAGKAVTFIKWEQPGNESIGAYTSRLLQHIKDPRPILIGLSFGGMIAIEVAKHIAVERIILISSAKTKAEIPFYYRLVGFFRIHRLLPTSIFRKTNAFICWLFGATSEAEKRLLRKIISDTDPVFVKWAIHQILCWKNDTYPDSTIHIHGSSDRILPIKFVKNAIKVEGGNHLMVINKAREIDSILVDIL